MDGMIISIVCNDLVWPDLKDDSNRITDDIRWCLCSHARNIVKTPEDLPEKLAWATISLQHFFIILWY
jgi:hypothetical protein